MRLKKFTTIEIIILYDINRYAPEISSDFSEILEECKKIIPKFTKKNFEDKINEFLRKKYIIIGNLKEDSKDSKLRYILDSEIEKQMGDIVVDGYSRTFLDYSQYEYFLQPPQLIQNVW